MVKLKLLQPWWRTSSRSAAASSAFFCVRRGSNSTDVEYKYNPARIESKWQEHWQQTAATAVVDNRLGPGEDKFYALSMFPYPSGRLHMGHVRVYTISDTIAHFYRMRGKKVLHPMGWDAFGLPAENAAIERGIRPAEWTKDNVSHMRSQLDSMGCHFDWHREVYTCSPDYYKWTQWLFLQLYKHGLAYRKKALVNWDPVDGTVLANEQVDETGCSWRSGAKVEQRYLEQWFFKITDYAEPLLQGLEGLDWPGGVKLMQSNWIGKSEGAFFDFQLQGIDSAPLQVYTTRPDTIFGVTYLAVSPEHDLLQNTRLLDSSVLQAVQELQRNSLVEKGEGQKNGIALGISAHHPFTGALVPVYAADYVVSDYGTKAVMGVPAHDERDRQFALKHSLPIVEVIDAGTLVHSEQFSGLPVEDGGRAIVDHAHSQECGGHMTQYKLRDWLISRQRYWGAPIPVLYCEECGVVPVSEDRLPVQLPTAVQFNGRSPSPLSQAEEWLRGSCGKPHCCARRETDTMDTFVDSSWYFLRYVNPGTTQRPFTEDVNAWMPVDLYIGGIEHAILHLLYARFVTHFLHDIGLVKVREPFQKLLTQGMVQGKTYRVRGSGRYLQPEEQQSVREEGDDSEIEISWEKMSKSKYNGVDPEDIVREYGADTVRLFMLFRAPPEMAIQWDIDAIQGVYRWLNRLWRLCQQHVQACRAPPLEVDTQDVAVARRTVISATHKAIKQVTVALEEKHTFNVAVAELMSLSNVLRDSPSVLHSEEFHQSLVTLCTLLAPMAPHMASELWNVLREAAQDLKLQLPQGDVLQQTWPVWSDELIQEETVTVILQVNGRNKGRAFIPAELTTCREELEAAALKAARAGGMLGDNAVVKKVFVADSGTLVSFVTE